MGQHRSPNENTWCRTGKPLLAKVSPGIHHPGQQYVQLLIVELRQIVESCLSRIVENGGIDALLVKEVTQNVVPLVLCSEKQWCIAIIFSAIDRGRIVIQKELKVLK